MTLLKTVQNLPALKAREAIPPAKRRTQVVKTVAGSLIFVGGFFLSLLGYPWYVGACVSAFGAHIASAQLLGSFIKALGQFVLLVTGKVPSEPPQEGRGAKVDE